MQFSCYQLVLFPAQTDIRVESGQLEARLRALGLLGAALGEGRYATGDAFLTLVCFLGCSPDIELEPQADKPFCYLQLPLTAETVEFQLIRKPAGQTGSSLAISMRRKLYRMQPCLTHWRLHPVVAGNTLTGVAEAYFLPTSCGMVK